MDNSSLEFLHSLLDCVVVVVVVVVVVAVVLVSGRIYDFMRFVQQRPWWQPGYRRCSIEGWNATEIDEEPGDAW